MVVVDDDNVIPFKRARTTDSGALDDDALICNANEKIAAWKAAGTPSLTEVQELFHESICAGASAMARDKTVDAVTADSAPSSVGSERCSALGANSPRIMQRSAHKTHATTPRNWN
jgi:hypothetical protein